MKFGEEQIIFSLILSICLHKTDAMVFYQKYGTYTETYTISYNNMS